MSVVMVRSGSSFSLEDKMRARALTAPAPWRLWLTAKLPPNIAGSRLILGLGLAMIAVAALEHSPSGKALQAGLASLEFDPARAALIAALIFCCLGALVAGALTARPWPSALAATGYLCLTHAVPWAWRMVTVRPVLFGSPERLDAMVLMHNMSTVVALGFVVAVPAAAAGRLLAELVSGPRQLRAPRPA